MSINKPHSPTAKVMLWFVKLAGASVVAFGLLCVFCLAYYNTGARNASESGATDYTWKPNSLSMRMTEGFGFVYIDKNGYNNRYPHEGEDVDILVLGSSQTEALNVFYNQNYVYRLNEKLTGDGLPLYAYNIGISEHGFVNCAQNLGEALAEFHPSQYAVIETQTIMMRTERLIEAYNGEYRELASAQGTLLSLLQKFPYLKLAYFQLNNMRQANASQSDAGSSSIYENQDMGEYEKALDALFGKLADESEAADVKLIILYQPLLSIGEDAKAYVSGLDIYDEYLSLTKRVCEKYGITLLDMSDRFIEEYETSHLLPHGFENTAVETGHINRYGHEMIADELALLIENDKREAK